MENEYRLTPIGRIRSSVVDVAGSPRQGRDAGLEAWIEVLPGYADALDGLAGRRQILVICWLHLAPRDVLRGRPQGDPDRPLTGVFATCSSARPNPIAVYTVDLLKIRGTELHVRGIDAVDGTPVVDIKPHIERLDD
jgi:tRNA-Thr(GGU) m(6)t(6)A37 methyltransferase TsaA